MQGLSVFERGWLSSNNILIHASGHEAGAWLIDTGHASHAEQTLSLVRYALGDETLIGIANTHLHNDHCGGNAVLQAAFGVSAHVPSPSMEAVRQWDVVRLGFDAIGHHCPRFEAAAAIAPGEVLRAGGRDWQALAAPGHDPDSLMFFDAEHGVLISADALWEDGFGLVFGELIGEGGFDEAAATLDLIESLPVCCVIPGHGAPFSDVVAALARSRSRLAAFRAEPHRHARHAMKALLKYHLMELREMPLAELISWAGTAPSMRVALQAGGIHTGQTAAAWCEALVGELVAAGQLVRQGELIQEP